MIAGGRAKWAEPCSREAIEIRPLVQWETAILPIPRAAAFNGKLGERVNTQSDAVLCLQVVAGDATTHAEWPLAGRDIQGSLSHSAPIR